MTKRRLSIAEIHILSPEELAAREERHVQGRVGRPRNPERVRIIEAYKAVLQQAQPEGGGDVLLTAGETKRMVREALHAAAAELNLTLDFRPIKDPSRLHFRVRPRQAHVARPRRAGRPRPRAGEVEGAPGAAAGLVQPGAQAQPAAPSAPTGRRRKPAL